jgi:hypothetical protein
MRRHAWFVSVVLSALAAGDASVASAAPVSFGPFPERVVRDGFETFRAAWKPDGGTWQFAAGIAAQNDGSAPHWATLEGVLTAPITSVETDLRLDGGSGTAGLLFSYRGATCLWALAPDGGSGAVNGFAVPVTTMTAPALLPGTWHRLNLVIEDDFVIARVDGAVAWYVEDAAPTGVSDATLPVLPGGALGLFSAGAEVSFDNLLVERPRDAWRYVVPIAPRTPGLKNTLWRTDLALSNLSSLPAAVKVHYLLAGQDNSALANVAEIELEGGQSRVLADVVSAELGLSQANGGLMIVSDAEIAVASRTYNQAGAGTYGQHVPATLVDDLIPAGETGMLVGVRRSAGYRTNVGFVNPSGRTVRFTVRLVDGGGAVRGTLQRSLKPLSQHQYTDVLPALGADALDAGRVEITADGPFQAYAMVIDNASGDPVLIPAVPVTDAGTIQHIPNLARVKGLKGSNWRSQVFLSNLGTIDGQMTLSFFLANKSSAAASKVLAIPANATLGIDDVVSDMLGQEGEGWLKVEASVPLLASARRYNLATDGSTFGQSVRILPLERLLGHGDAGVFPGLEKSAEFRSNLVLLNPGDSSVSVLVRVDGAGTSATKAFPVAARAYRNLVDIAGLVGHPGGKELRAVVALDPVADANSGARLSASVTVVDNRTNDPVGIGHALDRTVPVFVSLTPSGGPPGTPLVLRGAGLQASQALEFTFAGSTTELTVPRVNGSRVDLIVPLLLGGPGQAPFVGRAGVAPLDTRGAVHESLNVDVAALPAVTPAEAETIFFEVFAGLEGIVAESVQGPPTEVSGLLDELRQTLVDHYYALVLGAANGTPSTLNVPDPATGHWVDVEVTAQDALTLASLLAHGAVKQASAAPPLGASAQSTTRQSGACLPIASRDRIGSWCNGAEGAGEQSLRAAVELAASSGCQLNPAMCDAAEGMAVVFEVVARVLCLTTPYVLDRVQLETQYGFATGLIERTLITLEPETTEPFAIVAYLNAVNRAPEMSWADLVDAIAEGVVARYHQASLSGLSGPELMAMHGGFNDIAAIMLTAVAQQAGIAVPLTFATSCREELPPDVATVTVESPDPSPPQGIQVAPRAVIANDFLDVATLRASINDPETFLYAFRGADVVPRGSLDSATYAPATEFRVVCDHPTPEGRCALPLYLVQVTDIYIPFTEVGSCSDGGPIWVDTDLSCGLGSFRGSFLRAGQQWYTKSTCPAADGTVTMVGSCLGTDVATLSIGLDSGTLSFCLTGEFSFGSTTCTVNGCAYGAASSVTRPVDTSGLSIPDYVAANHWQVCP